jgi:hypothetical protein
VSKILDALVGQPTLDLVTASTHRSVVEQGSIIYRDISIVYPWKVVNAGALRHLVLILRFGDAEMKTTASATLAMCSKKLEIVKQMFSYGCIKPVLNSCNWTETNEACALVSLGCVVQVSLSCCSAPTSSLPS